MKMEIIESDLKQLFMWIKNLSEQVSKQNVLLEQHQDAIESLEKRIINIELLLTQEDYK